MNKWIQYLNVYTTFSIPRWGKEYKYNLFVQIYKKKMMQKKQARKNNN